MQLKSQVEWVLHCCAILAGLPANRYLATKALAEFHGVPKEYLSKALQALSQAGIVESTLGPSGGYRLARAPDQISFLEIVEAVEGKSSTFVCSEIRKNNPCRPTGHCETKACYRPGDVAGGPGLAEFAERRAAVRSGQDARGGHPDGSVPEKLRMGAGAGLTSGQVLRRWQR